MARFKKFHFPFPHKGIDRNYAYSAQPQFTCPSAVNVRPYDTGEKRARGGQRAGTLRRYSTQLSGAANPVRLLASVSRSRTPTSYEGTDEDRLNTPEGTQDVLSNVNPAWEDPVDEYDWSHDQGKKPYGSFHAREDAAVTKERGDPDWDYSFSGCLRRDLEIAKAQGYSIQCKVWQHSEYTGQNAKGFRTHFWIRMDDSSPDFEVEGVHLMFYYVPGITPKVRIRDYSGSTLQNEWTLAAANDTDLEPDTLRVEVDGDDVSAVVNGETLGTKTVSSHSGNKMGVGIENTQWSNNHEYKIWAYMDDWVVDGVKRAGDPQPAQTILVGSANGDVYIESDRSKLTKLTGTLDVLPSDRPIVGLEHSQKLYLPVYGDVRIEDTEENGTIGGGSNDELDDGSVADWTTHSIDTDTDVVILSECADGGPAAGTYEISAVSSDHVTLASGAGGSGSCSYRIEKAPRYWEEGSGLSLWTDSTTSAVPGGCTIGCVYRGRIVLSGDPDDPQNWYMSRIDAPDDWDYGQADVAAAIAGNNADAGKLGETITALIPHSDDYLVFGCRSSVWLLRGDPTVGGVIDAVDYKTGIVGPYAWCQSTGGVVYFLGTDGLYRFVPNQKAENLSMNKLPLTFSDRAWGQWTAWVEWDHAHQGVWVCLSQHEQGQAEIYYYDVRTQSFWSDTIPTEQGPSYLYYYDADTHARSGMMWGGRDGYIRAFDDNAANDDATTGTEAIESSVVFRPRTLGTELNEGVMTRFDATLPEGIGQIDYEFKPSDYAEGAVDARAKVKGTWRQSGRRKSIRRRLRASHLALKLSNSNADESWAWETAVMVSKQAGKVR